MASSTFSVVLGNFVDGRRSVEARGVVDLAHAVARARAYAAVYLGNAGGARVLVEEDGAPAGSWALELTLACDEAGVVHVVERSQPDTDYWHHCVFRGGTWAGPGRLIGGSAPVTCPKCRELPPSFRPRPAQRQRWLDRRGPRELVILDLVDDGKGARCAAYDGRRFLGRETIIATERLQSSLFTFLHLERVDTRIAPRLGPFRYGILLSRDHDRWLAEPVDPLAVREGPGWILTPTPFDREDWRDLYQGAQEVARVAALPEVVALAAQLGSVPEVVPVFPQIYSRED